MGPASSAYLQMMIAQRTFNSFQTGIVILTGGIGPAREVSVIWVTESLLMFRACYK